MNKDKPKYVYIRKPQYGLPSLYETHPKHGGWKPNKKMYTRYTYKEFEILRWAIFFIIVVPILYLVIRAFIDI